YSPRLSPGQKADRRSYYAARVAVMMRHHEISLYRMRAKENDAAIADEINIPQLDLLLSGAKVTDTMKEGSFRQATGRLSEIEQKLIKIRDYWIRAYQRS